MASLALDHLHLRSLDPDAAARFYVEALGGKVEDRINTPEMFRVVVFVGGVRLLIDRVPDGTPAGAKRPHRGLEHLGFIVPDLDATVADLKARGVPFTMEPTTLRPGLRISFILGPDDVSIEVLQRSD